MVTGGGGGDDGGDWWWLVMKAGDWWWAKQLDRQTVAAGGALLSGHYFQIQATF